MIAEGDGGWTIVWRDGGTLSCRWRQVIGSHTRETAEKLAAETRQMGFKVIVQRNEVLDTLGLPIGWEAKGIDWERDDIITNSRETCWTHHSLLNGGTPA